ncbi:MAG: helix-hairpin-helix domain-containing protein [Moraxella sp.]|nr:helix-hairpin-helix domain-containing protein [Moraxella sp.]
MKAAANPTPHQCFSDPKAAYAYLLARSQTSTKININTASAAELTTLHGVGVKTAEAIVQYRTQMGRFGRIEDLMNVKGIGEKTLENNRQRLSVYE